METSPRPVFRVRVEQDPDPESPAEWDNAAFPVVRSNRYFDPNAAPKDWSLDRAARLAGEYGEPDDGDVDRYRAFPLYVYAHSGVTLSLTPFACRWDSWQAGWIVVDTRDLTDGSEAGARAAAESIVETWNDYLSGNVYGYVVEQSDNDESDDAATWEHVESCWGIYGEDYARQEAESALKYARDAARKIHGEQLRLPGI